MVVDRLDRVGISEREGNLNLSCAVRHHIGGEPSTKPRNFGEKTAVIGIDLKRRDRKSTRLNSSHSQISYAVFCLKKKNTDNASHDTQPGLDPARVHRYHNLLRHQSFPLISIDSSPSQPSTRVRHALVLAQHTSLH